ncbi:MAG: tetratricopeptide repeat protein [Bacteroidetes bacterium]|nr:tetratricopeptide repeat protein [Bacteroidota bacterium]MCB0846741.1 tetratricopeptide repeat protein [Bacteroidota bacterium]
MKLAGIFLTFIFALSLGGEKGSLYLAQNHYEKGEYLESIRHYRQAVKDYPAKAAEIRFNIGQCFWMLDSVEKAIQFYHQAINQVDDKVSSLASNNIGILLVRKQNFKDALEYFKEAIILDQDNEIARYNYELLKKYMKGQGNPPPTPPNRNEPPPPSDPDEEDADKPDRNPDPDDEVPEAYRDLIRQLLQQRNAQSTNDEGRPIGDDTISSIQARRLLDIMRRNERQFLQQQPKRGIPRPEDKGKPDW